MKSIIAAGLIALSLSSLPSWVNAQTFDRTFKFINNTSSNVIGFYASNVKRSKWEKNIIEGYFIKPYSYVSIKLDDSSSECEFDLLAYFEDGETVMKKGFNVCAIKFWRISEEDPRQPIIEPKAEFRKMKEELMSGF